MMLNVGLFCDFFFTLISKQQVLREGLGLDSDSTVDEQ